MGDLRPRGAARGRATARRVAAARRKGLGCGALACAVGLALCAGVTACGPERVFPGDDWERRDPGALGLDEDLLEELAATLRGNGMVVVDGYRVASWGDPERVVDWYSAAKPVLSTLLFFAIQEGRVEGVDTPLAELGWKLRPDDRGMTLHHLANMTSGYGRPEGPGEAFAYNDRAIALYQRTLFDRIYDAPPADVALHPDRLGALGFEDRVVFDRRRRRMDASTRDFARIAWLWLNEGRWRDRVLLEPRFFERYVKPQVPADLPHTGPGSRPDYLKVGSFGGGTDHFTRAGPGIYGYNFWFNDTGRDHPDAPTWPDAPPDAFMAIGARGSCALVLPSQGAVVVASRARWGERALAPGARDAPMNRIVALATRAVTPAKPDEAAAVALTGELRQWHPLALTFDGPGADEEDDPNPFLDYRLDVTFESGGHAVTVPGFFAADGDAAESGATAGSHWRVRFTPDRVGRFRWRASFRRGEDVAVADDPRAGRAVAFDGAQGHFTVEAPPAGDPRARGALRYAGARYLRWAGSGEWFLKGGANSPENFLAYFEFDQTPATHRYGPHARDFRGQGRTWRDDRGRNVFGALDYLSGKGVNALYFLTMNVRGDGDDVWPFTDRDERDRYDVSKLAQWERVFSHMDERGIALHVVLQETENDRLLDGGDLGEERRLYHRELVARFAHHLAVTWNLGEENGSTHAQRRAFAEHLRALDPYDHPVVVHTRPDRMERVYAPLLGLEALTGASLQSRRVPDDTREWIRRSAEAGHPWVVSLDETGPSGRGVPPDADDPTHDRTRILHLWPHLMAGGAGVEWYFGYHHAHDDLDLEDFRSRDRMWDQTRHALGFFREHLPFAAMQPCDERVDGGRAYCLGRAGDVYALYLPAGGEARLDLTDEAGRFRVRWFDPRAGGPLHRGSVDAVAGGGVRALGSPPTATDRDWTALVRRIPPAGPDA